MLWHYHVKVYRIRSGPGACIIWGRENIQRPPPHVLTMKRIYNERESATEIENGRKRERERERKTKKRKKGIKISKKRER